jgi:hypothetical protein
MKKLAILFSYFVLALTFQVQAQESGPVINILGNSKDFGDIPQGQNVEHIFLLRNAGTQPLIIGNVSANCGCIVPSWTKDPVAPGKYAEIKVNFNSAGKVGKQKSEVRIYSNASEPIEKVYLISNVLTPNK